MSSPVSDDEEPLDPEAARVVRKVRWLMMISGATTMVGLAAVFGVIGYRLFKTEGSVRADVTAQLPAGSRVVTTAVTDDRIVVTIENGAAREIRTYDVNTLQPLGRLRFATEP